MFRPGSSLGDATVLRPMIREEWLAITSSVAMFLWRRTPSRLLWFAAAIEQSTGLLPYMSWRCLATGRYFGRDTRLNDQNGSV